MTLPSGCSLRTLFGARSLYLAGTCPSNMFGGSTMWSSTLIRIMSSIRMTVTPRAPFTAYLTSTSGYSERRDEGHPHHRRRYVTEPARSGSVGEARQVLRVGGEQFVEEGGGDVVVVDQREREQRLQGGTP